MLNFVESGLAQHFLSAGRAGGGECHTNQSGEWAITITATGRGYSFSKRCLISSGKSFAVGSF